MVERLVRKQPEDIGRVRGNVSFLADHIRDMRGYVYGEQPSDSSVIKLNTNENPYSPSPNVTTALAELDLVALRLYPDATATELRETIAMRYGLSPGQVLITNGGDEAIRLVATACLAPHDTMVSADPGYSLYPVVAAQLNARWLPMVLDQDFRPDIDAARTCIGQRARLVCIPNPNAPSGVLLNVNEIDAFAARYQGPLLIDEAYVDFVDPEREHNLVPLLARRRNLLLLRTFSKGYSLAGARVGYLLGDEEFLQEISSKVRDSYNVNRLSQAIARAAFEDQDYAKRIWDQIRLERQRVSEALRNLGYRVPESQTNFVLAQHAAQQNLASTYEELRRQKVLVRYFDTSRLRDRLRITIGTTDQNSILLEKLARAA